LTPEQLRSHLAAYRQAQLYSKRPRAKMTLIPRTRRFDPTKAAEEAMTAV
jgi:hypothetical protein